MEQMERATVVKSHPLKEETNAYLIRPIRSHTRSKHNTPLNLQLNKRPRRHPCTIEAPEQINAPQLLDLLGREVQRRLVLRAARVDHHAVDGARLRNDLVDDLGHVVFVCDVGFQREELAWVAGGNGGEVVARVADVDGVDARGAVGEAAVCDAEADAAVGAGDWGVRGLYRRYMMRIVEKSRGG